MNEITKKIWLLPINKKAEANPEYINNPLCLDTIYQCLEFYKMVGYNPPWICYFAAIENNLVGSCGYKGKPVNNTIEISYSTYEIYRKHGIGTELCRMLVELALRTNPALTVTARTLPEKNYSTRILEKNQFEFTGIVNDPDDGEVWEWIYIKQKY